MNYAQLTPVLLEALKAQAAQATATQETFEVRLRRLEAAGAQARR